MKDSELTLRSTTTSTVKHKVSISMSRLVELVFEDTGYEPVVDDMFIEITDMLGDAEHDVSIGSQIQFAWEEDESDKTEESKI